MTPPDRLPVATAHVVYGPLSDGAVLFSTKDEVYFGLNQVGAQVWELLPPTTYTLSATFSPTNGPLASAKLSVVVKRRR